MEFKDIIRTRRAELELTLDDIARYVDVSGATVSRWETGEIKNIRRDKIYKLAEILRVTPSYLMGWNEENKLATDDVSNPMIILNRGANKMSPEDQQKLLDMAKVLFGEETFKE